MRKAVILLFLLLSISLSFCTTEDLYSVNELNITGNVSSETLTFNGNGNVLNGVNVKVYLLGSTDEVTIDSLKVNGAGTPVGFDSKGYYFITNDSFTITGTLTLLSLGQVRLFIPGPVHGWREYLPLTIKRLRDNTKGRGPELISRR